MNTTHEQTIREVQELLQNTSTSKQKIKYEEFLQHMELLSLANPGGEAAPQLQDHELANTPIFTGNSQSLISDTAEYTVFHQYALLGAALELLEGKRKSRPRPYDASRAEKEFLDPRVYMNGSAPLSTFICGLQGAGKSHTMSCIFENFLFPSHKIGKLPSPVGGLIFNYDNHSSGVTVRPCEAVYLATHVPVTVLVSASNFPRMQKLYSTLGSNIPQNQLPKLKALKFSEQDLNLTRLLSLMSVDKSDHVPLYMECITSILREMATSGGNKEGLDYGLFKRKLDAKGFTKQQSGSLNQRLDILESFMDKAKPKKWNSMFEVAPGTLTIVDLSDPFVDEDTACALFNMVLGLVIEQSPGARLVVGLDEAHKYMTGTTATNKFTESLLSLIRQQRHYGARIIISTQEPTISAKLLDLCNICIVHRFASPEWLSILQRHIGALRCEIGADGGGNGTGFNDMMKIIMNLMEGEALIFAPSAIMADGEFESEEHSGVWTTSQSSETSIRRLRKLGMGILKVKIRKRITHDGGKSKLAVTNT